VERRALAAVVDTITVEIGPGGVASGRVVGRLLALIGRHGSPVVVAALEAMHDRSP
jgi:hypothetical protein